MEGYLIPRSTAALIAQKREEMLNGVVRMVGRMTEDVLIELGDPLAETVDSSVETTAAPALPAPGVEEVVERVLDTRLKSVLHDVDYRISVLTDLLSRFGGSAGNGRVVSSDLNLAHHMLDGFTFTDNSPIAGSVAWAGAHIVYKGVDYTITDSNTANKYIWWDLTTPTAFQSSATKPTLTIDDVIVAINDGGIARVVLVPGKMLPGGLLFDGSVGGTELGNGAVTAGKIGLGGISAANQFGAGVVDSNALGAGAVIAAKIGAGEVIASKMNLASHLLY